MAKYEVVAINRRTQQEIRKGFDTAPQVSSIARWLEGHGSVGGRDTRYVNEWVVARYYPSKKGWLILDFEHARPRPLRSRPYHTVWADIKIDPKPRPSLAAALMVITHRLALPEQLALAL